METNRSSLSESRHERAQIQREIIRLLGKVGSELLITGQISGMELHLDHDVHSFFRSNADPHQVLHLQAYPGLSSPDELCLAIREMDYEKLIDIRAQAPKRGGPSIGNEHKAVVRTVFNQVSIPHSAEYLINLLSNKLPLPSLIVEGSARVVRQALMLENGECDSSEAGHQKAYSEQV